MFLKLKVVLHIFLLLLVHLRDQLLLFLLEFFDEEIQKRNIKPTKLLPLWDLLGVSLGFGTAMLGKKAAMLCTASVEEVIDRHYKNQTFKLKEDEKELKNKINKFKYLGYALGSSLALAEYENARQNDNTVYTFATNYLDQILKNRNHLVNKISNLGINAINKSSTLKKIIIKSATGR